MKTDPLVSVVIAHPALFTELSKYPANAIPGPLLSKAIKEVGLPKLEAVAKDPKIKAEDADADEHERKVQEELSRIQASAGVG